MNEISVLGPLVKSPPEIINERTVVDLGSYQRKIRWYKGYLTTTFYNSSYISFSEKELLLLYNSLKYVLGDHNVSLESNII